MDTQKTGAIVWAVLFVLGSCLVATAADWGSITISGAGEKTVTLENSKLKAVYTPHSNQQGAQNLIRELHSKDERFSDVNMGNLLDFAVGRYSLTSAQITQESDDVITANLNWGGTAISNISIYPGQPFFEIEQVQNSAPNIVDQTGIDAASGSYYIYGADAYGRNPADFDYPKCYYSGGDGGCIQANGGSDPSTDPLYYNGWSIVGIYRADGLGLGRVIAKKNDRDALKLLKGPGFETSLGFEWFWNNHNSYMFVVTNGPEEMEILGKAIADFANGGSMPGATSISVLPALRPAESAMLSVSRISPSQALVRLLCGGEHTMQMFSTNGAVVFSRRGSGPASYRLPLSNVSAGVYVLHATAPSGTYQQPFRVLSE